jgi:hypothetical protein
VLLYLAGQQVIVFLVGSFSLRLKLFNYNLIFAWASIGQPWRAVITFGRCMNWLHISGFLDDGANRKVLVVA